MKTSAGVEIGHSMQKVYDNTQAYSFFSSFHLYLNRSTILDRRDLLKTVLQYFFPKRIDLSKYIGLNSENHRFGNLFIPQCQNVIISIVLIYIRKNQASNTDFWWNFASIPAFDILFRDYIKTSVAYMKYKLYKFFFFF